MSGGLYGGAVRLIGVILILLGIAICVRTISLGGGPFSFGLIVGVVLAGIGFARLWLATKVGSR